MLLFPDQLKHKNMKQNSWNFLRNVGRQYLCKCTTSIQPDDSLEVRRGLVDQWITIEEAGETHLRMEHGNGVMYAF